MCSRTHRLVVNKGNLEVAVEAEPSNLAVWPPEQFVRAPGVFLEQPEAKKHVSKRSCRFLPVISQKWHPHIPVWSTVFYSCNLDLSETGHWSEHWTESTVKEGKRARLDWTSTQHVYTLLGWVHTGHTQHAGHTQIHGWVHKDHIQQAYTTPWLDAHRSYTTCTHNAFNGYTQVIHIMCTQGLISVLIN